jgi:long-chain-acyl-CoA dehydrogenase
MSRTIFDDDHEVFRATVRTFLEHRVVAYVEKYAEEGILPREFWLEVGKNLGP